MRKIFLDIGAFDGISVEFFRRYYAKASEFEIYCFEPFPENIKSLEKVKGITIVPAAAWSSNGKAPLFVGKPISCSMYSDKRTGRVDPNDAIQVRTVDLAKYIKRHFAKQDEIWLKLNVEGAEYEIIEHLEKQGLIDWIDRWYVQWHAGKVPSVAYRHRRVKDLIKKQVKYGSWKNKNAASILSEGK